MPYVRFSRDKRGYEHTYLVHTTPRRNKPPVTQVLYWFRTPPGVKVGREAFDAETRQALERQYPDLQFDWKRITSASIAPPVEAERWRKRDKPSRQPRVAEKPVEPLVQEAALEASSVVVEEPTLGDSTPADVVPAVTVPVETVSASVEVVSPERTADSAAAGVPGRRRRRRRGGRRRRKFGVGPQDAPVPGAAQDQAPAQTIEPFDDRDAGDAGGESSGDVSADGVED